VLTVLHAGGKFENAPTRFRRLHGVGVSVVNALSERLDLEIWRNGQVYQQSYERGTPTARSRHRHDAEARHEGHLQARSQIFETTDYSFDTLAQRLRELAFLNGGIVITIDDERDGKSSQVPVRRRHRLVRRAPEQEQGKRHRQADLHARHSRRYRRRDRAAVERRLYRTDFHLREQHQHARRGTHLSGFRAALTRTINAYAAKSNLAKDLKDANISGDDIREGLTGVISVKIPQPQFEGQTKTKLGNTEVKGIVEAIVNDKLGQFLEENPAIAKRIIGKAVDAARAREAARKARDLVAARARSTAAAARQARRLSGTRSRAERALHRRRGVGRRIGQAGARSALPGDLPIKGKILNVEKARFDKMLGSDEIKTMIAALGAASAARISIATSCATTASSS
jgi:DNA gyrase subunit B